MAEKIDKKPFLVPVDFSPHSEEALLKACEFAGAMGAPIVVLHVVHDPGEMPSYYSSQEATERNDNHLIPIESMAREMFDTFIASLLEKHPKIEQLKTLEKKLVIGLPVSRIIEVAKKVDAAMVVMGSQGRTGLKRIMLGSKAEQVVRLCSVPVTIVKKISKEEQNH